MANADRVTGFKVHSTITGAPWNGATMKMYHTAGTTVTHDLYAGDMVIMSGEADTAGIPAVVVATAGDGNFSCGVITSIVPDADHLDRVYIDGASAGYVNVCTDPNAVFEAQADDTVAVASVGLNANMVQTNAYGNQDVRLSGQEVDATVATTSTYQLKIVGFPQRADNTVAAADNKVLVIINKHQFKQYCAGV